MKFESQICTTKEQSERLLALGLKKETADMYITNMSIKGINYTDDWQIGSIPYCNAISIWNSQGLQLEKTAWNIIPAWSLHRLMEIYTNGFSDSNWNMAQFNWNILIDCIECRIHEGYCNKEYLE